MALYQDPDPTAGDPGDWWSRNAPPPPPVSQQLQPGQPGYDPNTDPSVAQPPGSVTPPGMHWDPRIAGFVPNTPVAGPENPSTPTPTPPPGVTQPIGVPTSGFGAAPAPYVSNPSAPTYTPLGTYVPPTWTGGDYVNPTEADLLASPGYQARLDAGLQARERSAAAQGTVLNGGTLKAENRFASDYASNEYQTLRNNTFDAYKQRYSQFTDAAGMDLNARTINANENQNTFANRTATYNTGNARSLSDYITNVTNNRNAELDYWNRLQDVNNTGANLAGGSR